MEMLQSLVRETVRARSLAELETSEGILEHLQR